MNIIHSKDQARLADQAAAWLLERMREIANRQGRVVLAVPGGRSVAGIYSSLSHSTDPVWKRVHLFILDDRAVPEGSPESNSRLVAESFADHLIEEGILPHDHFHRFIPLLDEPDYGAAAYEKELLRFGGEFDLVLLSAGEDGHVAGLYPHHAALRSPKAFQSLNDSPKPPAKRVTATPRLITHARACIILFLGEDKRDAYKRFRDAHLHHTDCPAKLALEVQNLAIATDLEEGDGTGPRGGRA